MMLFFQAVLAFFGAVALVYMYDTRVKLKDRIFYLAVFIVLVILISLLRGVVAT